MDYLVPDELNNEQKDFIIERLAQRPFALIEIKEEFERFYGRTIQGEVIQKMRTIYKDELKNKKEEIYVNQISSLPLANAFPIIALCQSRVEELVKTPKVVRTVRKMYPDDYHIEPLRGREYFEEVKEIDDINIQKYITICQNERFNNLKLEISKIVADVDKDRLPKKSSSFRPVEVNTGFSDEKE